jgi:hypothetical protein
MQYIRFYGLGYSSSSSPSTALAAPGNDVPVLLSLLKRPQDSLLAFLDPSLAFLELLLALEPAWKKQVLSARGLKRVDRHSEYTIYAVWRCIVRGPGGSRW